MDAPLRILMVMHLAPSRELGGARIQLELAEHLRAEGHDVELFSRDEIFGTDAHAGPIRRRLPPRFSPRAVRRLRAIAGGYDVIDAQQGNIPVSKQSLGFGGLLVARSVGLVPAYQRYLRSERKLFPSAGHGTLAGRALRALRQHQDLRDALKSYATADLVSVPNRDEQAWLDDHLGPGRTVLIPYGLSRERQRAFVELAHVPDKRLEAPEVVFVGSWSLRKGAADWEAIWARIHRARPTARLRVLGVGSARGLPEHAEVVAAYKSESLPSLLASGTVGAFPSYIEGFPFAVLEQLAAGIPVVAYDAPGAREMLGTIDPRLLAPLGDRHGLADRVIEVLSLQTGDYASLAAACRELASQYSWETIAGETVDVYRGSLERVRDR
jgi:glycosyltransferase involved in cell wall biosynthesis